MTNWTSSLITGAGLWDQADRLGELGENVVTDLEGMANDARENTRFEEFGAYDSRGGEAWLNDQGSIHLNLDPDSQLQADIARDGATGLFADASGSLENRTRQAYDTLRATQRPGEERDRNSLQARLLAQGRGDISSAAYGGSPEMFGFDKAVAEARNTAAAQALETGLNWRESDVNTGTKLQAASYMPQAQLANLINPALNYNSMRQAGDIAGENLAAQLGLGAMQTRTNVERLRSDMIGNMFGTAAGTVANTEGFDPAKDLFDWVEGWF